MIRVAIVNVVEALRLGSDPKSLLTIDKQRHRSNRRAIEPWHRIAYEASIAQVAHSLPRPHPIHGHPDRPRRSGGHRNDAIACWMVHLLLHVVAYGAPVPTA